MKIIILLSIWVLIGCEQVKYPIVINSKKILEDNECAYGFITVHGAYIPHIYFKAPCSHFSVNDTITNP